SLHWVQAKSGFPVDLCWKQFAKWQSIQLEPARAANAAPELFHVKPACLRGLQRKRLSTLSRLLNFLSLLVLIRCVVIRYDFTEWTRQVRLSQFFLGLQWKERDHQLSTTYGFFQ